MSADSAKHDYQDLMRQTLIKLDDLQSRVKEAEYARTEPIAIIGLGCRFPGGANHPDAYWDLLRNGVDATCEVPADRWDKDAYYDPDPDASGKIYTRRGGFIDRIDTFEPPFFRIAAREAESMDPQQRLLLEVGWEALEYANIPAERLYNTPVGVFVGISRFDYAMYQMGSGDPRHITGLTGTGSAMCVAAGRLSFFLGVTGPSLIVDTACSSSLVALHLACESLRRQECQMALAGGVNLQIRPEIFVNMSRARMLSPDGHCKTFAATADGIALGEGAGMLALKRLSDAQQDGDRILALIRGSMVNQDGPSGGLTVPNGPSQERVIRQALHNAGVEPDAVSYIEAHGTGTPLGDPIEIGALGQVFGPRPMERPLFVGSVKTNLGHLEAAAGVSGIIKLILCFLNEYLPPHLHCEQPNPRIAWDRWPFLKITHEGVPWKQGDQPRIAGISGFGVSGTNAHIILQEPPQPPTQLTTNPATAPERPLHLLTLSAKSEDALQALTGRYIDHLENAPALSAGDLCFTANTGRSVFPQRLCVMAEDTDGLWAGLADFLAGRSNASVFNSAVKRERAPRLAFLFTGQGSQYIGMGRQLYNTEPVFREAIERCAAILDSRLAQPLLQVLYPPEGIESPIDDTAFTQPVIFAIEYALAALWGSWGLTPDIVLGHSVGDYAAACIAGVFTLEEGLHLIAERGRLMGALPRNGAMISVFAEASRVAEAIEPYADQISLAAINAPDRVVISGARDALSHALSELQAQGVETRDLQVSHAFHSPLLEPMLADFEAFAHRTPFRAPTLPFICNLTGRRLPSGTIPDAAYWRRHCREPVQFASSLEAVLEDSNVVCLEVGPQPVLTSLGQRCTTQPLAWLASLRRGRDDWQVLFRSLCDWYLQGGQVDWAGLDKHHPRQRHQLPFYPFQRKRYWLANPHLPGPDRHEPPPSVQPDAHVITAPPTAPPVSVADAATVPDVSQAQARKEQVRETLSEFISNIVGIDPVEIGDRVPFLEMGLDSILLLDAIRVIKERFAVEIKIRQFFEDIPDLASLIDFIAAHAEPEPIPVQPASTEDKTAAKPVADAASTTELAAMPIASDASAMERVINAQLQFMSQQLTALGDAIAKAAPHTDAVANASTNGLPESPPSQQSEVAAMATPPTPPAETADATATATAENRSSPLRALNASPQARHGFSARQEQHLKELTARYTRKTPKSKELAQASRGVLADSRAAFGFRFSTKELLYPITGGQALGSRLTDIDGNTYVDLTMGFGVLLFGNHPQFVTDAVAQEMQRGIQLGPRSDLMQRVATLFTEMTGTERVAFNNSGTEAVMTAVRLARTKTERTRIALFEGAYHGHADGTLIGGRVRDGQVRSYPMAPGVPQSMADNAIVLEYGSPASLAFLRDHAHDLAAVLVEPVQSRRPGIRPIDFLHDLRRLTAASGTALIFDEMITGFRVHQGGLRHLWGIEADMTTYGKIVGGGLPIGAIAGSREYLDTIDGGMWQYGDRSYPAAEKTYFAGTFSQHPFVMAAALAVLEHLQAEGPALQERLNQRTARLAETLNTWFQDEQLPIHVDFFSSWFLFKSEVDLELFYYHMLVQGVYICEGRSCFLSTAHTEDDLDTVVRAVKNSVNAMRDGGFLPARTKPGTTRAIPMAEPIEIPLSRAQQQLSILVDLEPEGSLAYHDPTCLRLTGPLHLEFMQKALSAVVARHEALRTVIDPGAEIQRVLPDIPVTLPLQDISGQDAATREITTASWLDDVCNRPLDPIAGPAFRAALLKLSEHEHLMAFNVHHILVDGWSVGVILRELGHFYSAYCRGETYDPAPPMPYQSWLRWQEAEENSDAMAAHEAWWLERFRQPVAAPSWPTAAPRPPVKTWNGGRRTLCLEDQLVRRVVEYANKQVCTPFMIYFAVYTAWLHRLTGQDDLVIGTPTAGRSLDGAGEMVGYCAHLLPIRSDSSENPVFSDFLQRVKSNLLDAYEHETYPFSRLIDKLNVRQDHSRSPLVDTLFNFEVPSSLAMHALSLESVDCPIRYTAFDLTFSIMERVGQTLLDCDYNTDLFDADTVDRFLEQFRALLARVTDPMLPDPPFSTLSLLTAAEKHKVLVDWNDTTHPATALSTFMEAFEARAAEHPEREAVVASSAILTYGALNGRANRLAHYLRRLGVAPEEPVGICVERSLDMMVGLLGILKAGAAYVPLDPEYPQERLAYMLTDSQARVVITQSNLLDRLPVAQVERVCLDADWQRIAWESPENPVSGVMTDHLAYVIYTSGSTGQPKGVQIPHGALMNFLHAMHQQPGLRAEDTLLAVTTISFDIAALELYLPLMVGACVVIADQDETTDGTRLMALLASSGATVMQATPATWRLLLEAGWQGNRQLTILCGGEALPRGLADQLLPRSASLWNLYGPTETTIWSAACTVEAKNGAVPIGRPIANTQLYVLDVNHQPVPIGVTGELYIGGAGLARGYRHLPKLTATAFIPDAFSATPGARLYHTGDLARYQPDGTLDFLGRIDTQVKIRGFRIELGEVEATLSRHPTVAQVLVTAQQDPTAGDHMQLIAYAVPQEEAVIDIAGLREWARERLPGYMVPAAFVPLPTFPLTPNGKVDRKALPAPNTYSADADLILPRTPTETLLSDIWAEVLNVPRVGMSANFFDDLGGHSLLGARVLSKVRDRLGVALPFRTLFESPTVRDLAEKIEAAQGNANGAIRTWEAIPRLSQETVPRLSLAQQRLWFLDRLTGPSPVYNMPFAIRLEGALDRPALEHALIEIVRRHDALRTAIAEVNGEGMQLIHASPHVSLPCIAPEDRTGETQSAELERLIAAEAQQPFDLSQAPLLRTTLVRLAESVHVLMVTMHHIVSDGWSISVFLRELSALYNARVQNTMATLPELPIRYADYAHWQRQYMQGELLGQRLAFWKDHLHGAPTLLELPTDHPRPSIQTYRGRIERFTLDAELTQRLHALGKDTGATLFMTLLTGYATLLSRYTGSDDIVIGSVFANRDRSEFEPLIGFFVNTLPLRVRLSDNPTTRELTTAVRQLCLDAHVHQDLPFERLVDELEPERNLSHSPLFQVVFALQNLPDIELEFEALTCTEIKSDAATAKWELNLSMEERGGVLMGEWEYNTDLFDPPTISRMIGHFRTLLASMCAAPDQPVSGLSILTESERQQLASWNATAKHYGPPKPLHRLFEEQVTATPDRMALVFQDTTLTYAALNGRANRLAACLRRKGVGPDVPVALYMERSLELVVGLFGVLKAGGAYLPLDPEYPRERLAFMIQDTAAPVVLTQQYLKAELPEHQAEVLCLDTFVSDTGAIDTEDERDPQVAMTDSHAAYIIYTSGSTGLPKGAINTHGAIRNRLLWMQEAYRLDETDRVLQKTPYSFDVSVWEFFWPLITGACLVVAAPGAHRDSAHLVRLLREQHITVLHFVPSMLEAFLEEPALDRTSLPSLRKVICSGEALTGRHRDRFFEQLPGAALHNLYGPTEAAIDVTYRACAPEDEQVQVPIGCPIANMRMHLLDQHLRPVPVGVPGELHIAGVGLARGYLRRPELTAEKFIPDPFAQQVGERLYKTGDRVRYLPNGDIDFLGRIDFQVKIRGFRIELGEIEAALETVPGIDRAVVMAQEDGGALRLVAYLVTADREAVQAQNPRGHIAQTLPDYMVPPSLVYLDTLPLSPNGKIDRRALPAPDRLAQPQSYAPPTTPEEAILAEIWSHVLGVPRVGIDDSFFELGGDSILSLKILAQATRAGLSISLQDLFRHGTVRELARMATTGETTGAALLQTEPFGFLSDKQRATLTTDAVDAYPLTHLQAGMLFHAELHPDTAIYHDVFSYLLQAPLDIECLQRCLQHVVDRHPVLRTGFVTGTTVESLQVVYHRASIDLPLEDVSHLLPADRKAVVEAWINAEKQRPFSYTQPPLLRAQVHRCSAETFYLTLSFHHCILDGWSVVSLLAELFHDYFRHRQPSLAPLEPLPEVSFRDFVALERHALGAKEQRRFWAEQLEGFTVATLPRWPLGARLHEPAPAEVGEYQVTLDADISDGLKTLAAQAGVPIKSVLLAAHCRVLAQLCNQSDIVTGITINGRPEQAGSERILGLFLNTLPLRLACLSGTWLDLVQDAWKAEQELWPRRHFPLFELQHMMGGQPLFETCFNFTHFHIYQEVHELTGLEVLDFLGFEKTNFTLTANFGLSHDASEVMLTLSYDPQALMDAQVCDIASYYTQVLNAIATQPEAHYETHALLSPAETHKLLVDVNATAHPAPSFPTFIDAFEARVAEHPDRQAVVAGDAILTYGALNRRANQLAHYLQRLGAGPEVPVGVCMNRTPDLMVALLAVLKAGAAFVPMDPANPQARLAFMLHDAQVPVLLTRSETVAALPETQARAVQLDADWELISREDITSPARQLSSQHLAYVIYTSGSTGTPKGTLLTHGGLANYLDWCRRQYESCAEDGQGGPVHGSIGFDATLTSLLSPLNVGRAVFLIPEQNELEELAQALFSPHRFSLVKLTPAHLEVLGQGFHRQRIEQSPGCLVIGGEALHEESLAPWRASFPHTRIYNEYGPTESVVGCCVYDASASSPLATAVPIGQPSSNIRLYITDAFLQLVPTGTPGELLIGGAQLARGYLGRPALTAERFIPDPLSREPGTRLYRTGDATRYLPGERTIIEFLGRMDHQVKIRGYRIELGEIEAVLKQHPQVSEAAVLVRENPSGDQRLAAYVQAIQGEVLTSQVLHDFLQEHLPDYMVPSVFSYLDAFPLTANGKLDRRALPAPDWADQLVSFVAPRSQTETLLADIWAQVLGLQRSGIDDDFFECGGHSLLATQLISRIRDAFARDLPLQLLFDAPTPRAFAEHVDRAERNMTRPLIRPVSKDEPPPLSFAQQRLWLVDQLRGPSPAYNIPAMIRFEGHLETDVLERAFQEIVRRHEVLRTNFADLGHGPVQVITPEVRCPMPLLSLEHLPEDQRQPEVRRLAAEEAEHPFDLAHDPLLRLHLLRLAPASHVLLITVHHIVADGWSIGIFLQELGVLYEAFMQDKPSPLAELSIQYADFARCQREWLDEHVLAAQLDYWREQLRDLPERCEFPPDRPRPEGNTASRASFNHFEFDPPLLADLRALNRREHVTLFMTLLAAFDVVLWYHTGLEDIAVGTDIANRNHSELEGLIGFFVNQLVLRTQLDDNLTFSDLLQQVKAMTLASHAHQDLPFDKLVRHLAPDWDLAHTPFFQTKLVLQNASSEAITLPGLESKVVDSVATESKFDLIMNIAETEAGLIGIMDYNRDLYLDATMHRLWRNYEFVLRLVANHPESRLASLRRDLAAFDQAQQEEHGHSARNQNLQALQGLRRKRNRR